MRRPAPTLNNPGISATKSVNDEAKVSHSTYLGLTARQLGDSQSACEYCQRAVHIAQQVGATYEEGLALTQLGYAWLSLGQSFRRPVFLLGLAVRRKTGQT